MTYDPVRHKIFMHGGGPDGYSAPDGQTYEWDGSVWRVNYWGQQSGYFGTLTYDAGRDRLVFLWGTRYDVYEHANGGWGRVFQYQGPPAFRWSMAGVYDPVRHYCVMRGGIDGNYQSTNQIWTWDGTQWGLMGRRFGPPVSFSTMAYDSYRGVIVGFGGGNTSYVGETWEMPLYGVGIIESPLSQSVCPGQPVLIFRVPRKCLIIRLPSILKMLKTSFLP